MIRFLAAALLVACGGGEEPSGLPELFVPRDASDFVFQDPEKGCVSCHPSHVAEWRESNHAYAMVDPVFLAMNALGQKQTSGKLGQFCVQCHSPIGLQLQQTQVTQDPETGDYVQDFSQADPVALKGVACDVCHSITDVMHPSNAQMVYTPDGTYRATIQDPVETAAHASAYSELHESSDLCGSCHNVVNPAGALIEETYDEWASSSFAAEGRTCQSCHMPEYTGKAATEGPERTIHRHWFTGVDVSLVEEDAFPGYWEGRQRAEALLASAVDVTTELDVDALELTVSIANLAGHRLPSGATAERQMWIEIVVTDGNEQVVYETGTPDENGDLRDGFPEHTTAPGTDPDLVKYGQDMFRDPAADGATGEPYLITFPWQATFTDNHLIEPGATDVHGFAFGDLPGGRYTASVRLLFRTFPPYFLRELEELAGLDPLVKTRMPTQVMFKQDLEFDVEGPPPVTCAIPGDIPDCDGECWPDGWVGDGFCDDGSIFGADFNCAAFGDDGGDCGGAAPCPAGGALDCQGACWPDSWVGDGYCDDGTPQPWGDPDFDCPAWGDDGGDCTGLACPVDEVEDCLGVCWPTVWVGDGFCDDGTLYPWGDPDFACDPFAWDAGDCPVPGGGGTPGACPYVGWIEDCQGTCWPGDWVGDGFCDDGALHAWGDPDFDCAAFGDDGGDC